MNICYTEKHFSTDSEAFPVCTMPYLRVTNVGEKEVFVKFSKQEKKTPPHLFQEYGNEVCPPFCSPSRFTAVI